MSLIPMTYQTAYRWTGAGEAGELTITDRPPVAVGSPRQADRLSPEQMVVAAAETCLANYVLLFAEMSGVSVRDYRSTAEGTLVQEGKTDFRFERVVVRPEVTVEAGREETMARLMEKAHAACLVARSLACPVEMEPLVRAAGGD